MVLLELLFRSFVDLSKGPCDSGFYFSTRYEGEVNFLFLFDLPITLMKLFSSLVGWVRLIFFYNLPFDSWRFSISIRAPLSSFDGANISQSENWNQIKKMTLRTWFLMVHFLTFTPLYSILLVFRWIQILSNALWICVP